MEAESQLKYNAVHTKILTALFDYFELLIQFDCFLLEAGITNKWCPKIIQITNRWWISEAVENMYRKTTETWDICVLKTRYAQKNFQ